MTRLLMIALFALVPGISYAQDNVPELDALLKKAASVRPNARDLVWRQIPWYTDAAEALRVARAEKRPLFVWLAGGRDRDGDPLERC